MNIEVELKFPLADLSEVHRRLSDIGCDWFDTRDEIDTYYAHPSRNFAETDEVLRIRRVGERNLLAYKGPKLDTTTKSRKELELPLSDGDEAAQQWATLLELLGFRPVATVRKHRLKGHVPWQGRRVEASLDKVDEVGVFVELELVVAEDAFEAARSTIAALAEHLRLSDCERRSYLELLLQRRSSA